jgi:hypothetical protein
MREAGALQSAVQTTPDIPHRFVLLSAGEEVIIRAGASPQSVLDLLMRSRIGRGGQMRYPVFPVLGITNQTLATFEPHVANLDSKKFAFPQAGREANLRRRRTSGRACSSICLTSSGLQPGDGSLFRLQTLYSREFGFQQITEVDTMPEDLLEHLEFIVQRVAGDAILHADRLEILYPGEVHLARCAGKEGDKTNPDHEASSIMRGSGKVGLHPGFVRVRQVLEWNFIRQSSSVVG